MEINITDEQINEIAERQIKQIVSQRVGEVLNSEYWQTMSERIDSSVRYVVNERITESRIDKALAKIDMTKLISNMSKQIMENLIDGINNE